MNGCLKDEGNYTYEPLRAPEFGFTYPQSIYCYENDTARLKGKIRFTESDSVERMANVRFEWVVNGVVLSDEKDFEVPTDTIMAKLGLTEYPDNSIAGSFNVIEKESGMKYMYVINFSIRPKFRNGQWVILSKNGENSKLSFQQMSVVNTDSGIDTVWNNYDNIYLQNNGEEIPGRPIRLIDHAAPNISKALNATLVLTDKVAYEINTESFKKVYELKDQFLDGTPENFRVVDAYHDRRITYLATEDGRLFKRTFTENYLGGKFISTPYSLDTKGYDFAFFGNGAVYNWTPMFLCYDKLNRRVLSINQHSTSQGIMTVVDPSEGDHPVKIWDMDEDTDVLQISQISDVTSNWTYYGFCMIYNQGGVTYMADFVLQQDIPYSFARIASVPEAQKRVFPGGLMNKNTKFVIIGYGWSGPYLSSIFYTKGKELRYVNRANDTDNLFMTFDADITAVQFDCTSTTRRELLGIGLANGDFMRVDIKDKNNPRIIKGSRFNVGGEIVDISNTGGGHNVE